MEWTVYEYPHNVTMTSESTATYEVTVTESPVVLDVYVAQMPTTLGSQ